MANEISPRYTIGRYRARANVVTESRNEIWKLETYYEYVRKPDLTGTYNMKIRVESIAKPKLKPKRRTKLRLGLRINTKGSWQNLTSASSSLDVYNVAIAEPAAGARSTSPRGAVTNGPLRTIQTNTTTNSL
ncbi:hypothetical protein EVAR_7102_1 [Eumeta japonica]|uniref:Uncharacterized protein n=1 Tax=Eumeta variegata TaxID=151549 RepID=A0A4C1YC84_EUMVA|nr:hypothetical protein EVAR_7102_1 [Eumeta japonica]